MSRRIIVLVTAVLLAAAPATAARAQEASPGANLGGYDSLASASVFSIQPFLPALIPTGDVPFEATLGLTNARVTSGGNSFGRASLLWPGDAVANLGPLLMAAGLEEIGALLPPYPIQAQASQVDGVVEASVPPALVMRARGFPDQGSGESRLADVELPGFIRVDKVASTSSSIVTADDVTSSARSVLSGVSLLGGTITIEEIRSVARTRSTGFVAESTGTTDVTGLRIAGVEVSVTQRGFEVVGIPGAEDVPLPGMEDVLSGLLDSLGISLRLFEGSVTEGEGRVQRFEPGLVLSIDSPIPETGPIPPGRFDIFLATASASTMATSPFAGDGAGPATIGNGDGPASPAPVAALGREGEVDLSAVSGLGDVPGVAAPPAESLQPGAAPASDYTFGGVPVTMALALLLAALVAARYVRGFLGSIIAPREEGDAGG